MARMLLTGISAILIVTVVAVTSPWAQSGSYRHAATIVDDGQGNSLKKPDGVACEGSRVVIADSRNNRILYYNLQEDAATLTSEVKLARQIQPGVLQFGASGQLMVYDSRAKEVLHFDRDGKMAGKVEARGVADPARIIMKTFRTDKEGNIFLLDVFGTRVVVLDRSGTFKSQIAFPGEYGFISDLSVERNGRVLILDSINPRVYAAEPGAGFFAPLTGDLRDVLTYPTHMETDSRGLIYIVDEESSTVAVLRRDGSFLKKLFNRGRKEGLLYYPTQICVEDGSRIIIADRDNNRVQVFLEKE